MKGSPVPMYAMPCSCGITWYTTDPSDRVEHCRNESPPMQRGKPLWTPQRGCGARLPVPVPESTYSTP